MIEDNIDWKSKDLCFHHVPKPYNSTNSSRLFISGLSYFLKKLLWCNNKEVINDKWEIWIYYEISLVNSPWSVEWDSKNALREIVGNIWFTVDLLLSAKHNKRGFIENWQTLKILALIADEKAPLVIENYKELKTLVTQYWILLLNKSLENLEIS
jgi:hypothetical protein